MAVEGSEVVSACWAGGDDAVEVEGGGESELESEGEEEVSLGGREDERFSLKEVVSESFDLILGTAYGIWDVEGRSTDAGK